MLTCSHPSCAAHVLKVTQTLSQSSGGIYKDAGTCTHNCVPASKTKMGEAQIATHNTHTIIIIIILLFSRKSADSRSLLY